MKDDALKAGIGLKERNIFSDEQAASDVERIDNAYARVGRRDASVSYEVVPLENNRVNVVFRVNEGGKTKIAAINFVGNDTFSGRRLQDVISTKQSTIFSFLQSNDVYDQNRLNADEEALRRFYFNKGFADFQVVSTSADLDEVANEYILTFTVEEGTRYTFGSINVDSTVPGLNADALPEFFETVPGDYYSAKKVEETILNITREVSEAGFAFVEVVPRGNRNFDTGTIDVTYLVDEGPRVYIEDIIILGNDKTRDYVIRREFDVSEGDAYNKVLIEKTRKNIEAMALFSSVKVSTSPGSTPDRVRVVVSVVEKSTGDISLSGGYSLGGGPAVTVALTEKNFLGRGQYLKLAYSTGTNSNTFSFNFTEPFFLGYRISAGVAYERAEVTSTSNREYDSVTDTGKLTFGVPITEELSAAVFYSYIGSDTSTTNTVSPALQNDFGNYTHSGFGYTLTYNTLDNIKTPNEGWYASLTQTFYGAGGDARYLKSEGRVATYVPISEEDDLKFFGRVRGGIMNQFGGDGTNAITDTLRTVDNFQAYSKTIRGFDSFGYGPRDSVTGDALGGQIYWNATAELLFPFPFTPKSMGLTGALFADAGQLYKPGDGTLNNLSGGASLAQADSDSVRASVGASVIWRSPFGPLRFDYAYPIAKESFDDLREFSFGISSSF